MKVVSTEALTKLIQLIKSSFISVNDVEQTSEIAMETTSEVSLATVATTGSYSDLSNKPDLSVYALDANVVKLTGNQTIEGDKLFSGNGNTFSIQNTGMEYDVAPSATISSGIAFKDLNGALSASIGNYRFTDNSSLLQLDVHGSNGSWSSQPLGLRVLSDGTSYALAPASDINGTILTTVDKSKALPGYFKLGNGLIVQWGNENGGTATEGIVTYPIPFSGYYYRVVANSDVRAVTVSVYNESATGFNWLKGANSAYIRWIAIGC